MSLFYQIVIPIGLLFLFVLFILAWASIKEDYAGVEWPDRNAEYLSEEEEEE